LLAAVSVIYGLLGVFIVVPVMREWIQSVEKYLVFSRCFKGGLRRWFFDGEWCGIMVISFNYFGFAAKVAFRPQDSGAALVWAPPLGILVESGRSVRQTASWVNLSGTRRPRETWRHHGHRHTTSAVAFFLRDFDCRGDRQLNSRVPATYLQALIELGLVRFC